MGVSPVPYLVLGIAGVDLPLPGPVGAPPPGGERSQELGRCRPAALWEGGLAHTWVMAALLPAPPRSLLEGGSSPCLGGEGGHSWPQ